MAKVKDGLQLLPKLLKLFRRYYVKNISYLFDTVLLRIQADSYKHIH